MAEQHLKPSVAPHHLQGTQVPFSRPPTPKNGSRLQLGFCGLGAMGYAMAKNLAKERTSHPGISPYLIVYNRTKSKGEKLAQELGQNMVKVVDSPEDVARLCDVVFTNLSNDDVVKTMYVQFVNALKGVQEHKNKIFVETSTVYPVLAGELDQLISSIPLAHLVMAPVFGPPPAAEAAQLLIAMAGEYRAKKEVAHILVPAVARKVMDLGNNLEKAATFKLIGNSVILGTIEILAEAFTLAEKAGIPASQVHAWVKDYMPTPTLINYGEKMVNDSFDGSKGFAIDGGIKDSTHIRRLTTEINAPMPVVDAAHQHLLTARAIHASQRARGQAVFETLDWSSLVAGTRVAAGLDGFDSSKHARAVPEKID